MNATVRRKYAANSTITILIIDDNEEIRSYLKDLLSPYYSIELADSGEEYLGFYSLECQSYEETNK